MSAVGTKINHFYLLDDDSEDQSSGKSVPATPIKPPAKKTSMLNFDLFERTLTVLKKRHLKLHQLERIKIEGKVP